MRIFLQVPGVVPEGSGEQEKSKEKVNFAEKRRYPRHRMSLEISEGGMSAATPNYFQVGESVELYPILGDWVKAIVRRKKGAMYGFAFVGLTEQQKTKIREMCKGLPPFTSMADI